MFLAYEVGLTSSATYSSHAAPASYLLHVHVLRAYGQRVMVESATQGGTTQPNPWVDTLYFHWGGDPLYRLQVTTSSSSYQDLGADVFRGTLWLE